MSECDAIINSPSAQEIGLCGTFCSPFVVSTRMYDLGGRDQESKCLGNEYLALVRWTEHSVPRIYKIKGDFLIWKLDLYQLTCETI